MSSAITLRPVGPGEEAFLYRVFASTRVEELALTSWDAPQKEAFLRMQFHAQHRYYQEQFPNASYQVILRDGVPAGRLYLGRWESELRIIDIALLPEHRNAGTGTFLLGEILAEGDRVGKKVSIHVERFNPAQRLYERLGFVRVADLGVYYLLERPPAESPPGSRASGAA
jgi:ribosomal protein S18 acetylase RimI-like enzyme